MRLDFSNLHKRWSTWLAGAATASALTLGAYTTLPMRV
jgi:hypothetical protein